MQIVRPDYFGDFRCTAGECRHSCCIGWEIDIDPQTAARYKTLGGALGDRLRTSVDFSDTPHFILGEGERCPFLNGQNLCDIIIALGEQSIPAICADHPRFRNELPDRVEVGLGLCCEAAAELILSRKAPVKLVFEQDGKTDDQIIKLRDSVILALQNRSKSIHKRVEDMLALCGADDTAYDLSRFLELLLTLERLSGEWTQLLSSVKQGIASADFDGFDRYMASRESEYEQLLVYLIYRHFANAPTLADTPSRAAFAALIFYLLRAVGAVQWTKSGSFPFDSLVNAARLYSAEIEYSDENLYIILDELE